MPDREPDQTNIGRRRGRRRGPMQSFLDGFLGRVPPAAQSLFPDGPPLPGDTLTPESARQLLESGWKLGVLQFFDDGQEMPSMEVLVQLAPFDAPDVAFTFQNGRGAIDVRVEEVASMTWAGNVAPVVPVGFGPLGILAASFASAADRATSTWSAEISLHNRGYLIMQLQRSPRPADLTRLRARLA